MPVRLRKFIGAIALFALVAVWALLAMALAQLPSIRENTVAATLYYIVAGIGWVIPAMPLVRWMSRGPQGDANVKNRRSETGTRKPKAAGN